VRKLAVIATALVAVVGLASAPAAQGVAHREVQPSRSAGYTPPPINWHACSNGTGLKGSGARCGHLVVPLSYAHPNGAKIHVAVSRVRHSSSAANYQGIMLANPGGPGGSGLTASTYGSYVPGTIANSYDWIGFDPRGVGASTPSLSCDPHFFGFNRPNYVPKTHHLMRVWLRRSKHYARACAHAKASRILGHVKSIDTVRDMESLRKALGQDKISFYGYSYGTYLAEVYATLHPKRVGRFVLDGNIDPRTVWYKGNLNQDVAFEYTIKAFWKWVARYHKVYHLGTSAKQIEKRYYRELNMLDRHPAGGKIGPDELSDVMLDAGYYVLFWEDDASAYAALINHHNYKPVMQSYRETNPAGPKADNEDAMYLATQCTDAHWPQSWARQRRDNTRLNRKHPFLTWGNAWFNAPCTYWPAKAGHPVKVDGSRVTAKILLINETFDAATPYAGALEVRHRFPSASLIEGVRGTTHAGSLSGVACTDNAVERYLTSGTVPPRVSGRRSDKQCRPVPQPRPASSAASPQLRGGNALMDRWRRLTR
jgi:pimeloyl-ACP methyl ester carboxylesterase